MKIHLKINIHVYYMTSKKIHIRLRASVSDEPYGRTISFADIDKGGTRDRTWINYVNFIGRFQKILGLPDKTLFYWEHLSRSDIINKIIEEILSIYNIRDGNALAAKLSPFRSMIFRMNDEASLKAIAVWGETVTNSRKNFHSIMEELKLDPKTPTAVSVSYNWVQAREHLHNISTKQNIDPRVRVLATIYKYGYIFRMSTVFSTYIHLGCAVNRDDYNFLDLDRCIWSIVDKGVQKLEFRIPVSMAKELRLLTSDNVFSKGWLVPQRRGTPYAPEASLSSFSSWSKAGLSNYRTYRKLFLEWLETNVSKDEYTSFINILDSHVAFSLCDYIPPNLEDVVIGAEDTQDVGKEIISSLDNALMD